MASGGGPGGRGFGFSGFAVKTKEGEKSLPVKASMPSRGLRPGLLKPKSTSIAVAKKPRTEPR